MKMRGTVWNVLVVSHLLVGWAVGQSTPPEDFVNIMIGSDTRSEWSFGNQLPVVGLPWGHTYWAPEVENNDGAAWWFTPKSPKLMGIRCTHQPSPWIGDWGWFRIQWTFDNAGDYKSNAYDPHTAVHKPFLFESDIIGTGMEPTGRLNVSLTAAHAASIIKMAWPTKDADNKLNQHRMLYFVRIDQNQTVDIGNWTVTSASGKTTIDFSTTNKNGMSDGIINHLKYEVFVHVEIDQELDGNWVHETKFEGADETKQNDRGSFKFDEAVDDIIIRTGVSLISKEQAISNMGDVAKGFDALVTDHKAVWNKRLKVIKVEDSGYPTEEEDEVFRTYFSNLWRTALYPRDLAEIDKDTPGKWIHWSPYDMEGKTFDGHLSTDSGFWDAYHTVYSVLELLWPDRLNTAMEGYVNAFKEGGWVPQWSSPSYKASMVGTMSDCSFASAIVKGFTGFDVTEGLKGMRKNAFDTDGAAAHPPPPRGRRGLEDFRNIGYVPKPAKDTHGTVNECVSRTLNHAFADYCIFTAAESVDGQTVFDENDMDALEKGKDNWKNVWNPTTKFFQQRDPDGEFIMPFDQYMWGHDYTEGGPWQFRFYAPHDIPALAQVYGGIDDLCDMVNEMNIHPPHFHRGVHNYGSAIHEMYEMTLNCWGQYSHNNQPSHHAQYVPIAAFGTATDTADKDKCLYTAQKWVKKVMTDLYGPLHYSGDEDNGEMAGWLIMSSMGFYDMAPSSPNYVIGVPLFKEIEVEGELVDSKGLKLKVKAANNGPAVSKVTEVKLVGASETTLSDFRVTFKQLIEARGTGDTHGELVFTMAAS